MTTLTLTPLPDLGAVRIEAAGAAAGPLSITRTDANGSRDVRQAPDQVTSAGTLVLVDYEPALVGQVDYTAASTRTNAVTNPSFEANTTGWTMSAGVLDRIAITTDPVRGAACARCTGVPAPGSLFYPVSAIPAAAGQTWTVSAYVKGTAGDTVRFGAIGYTAAGASVPGFAYATFALDGTWQRISQTYVLPATSAGVRPVVSLSVPNQVLLVDAVMAEQTDTLQPYVEGTVPWPVTASTTLDGQVAGPIVASVVRPARRADVQALVEYSETYPGSPTALVVIDRDDPIVLLGNAARRTAEAGLLVETYAEAQAVVESVRAGSVVMFRQVTYAGMDAYGVVTSTRVTATHTELDEPAWLVTIGYLAVPAPDDALAGAAAWTYADVAALGVTYAQLRALFATYYALAVGA